MPVRINRIFRYEQTPFGYDVFDSRYPTSLNAGGARLLADGFTYSGTINTQGRFTPDAISRRRIDSLAARMAVIMSGSRSEEHTSELQSLLRISYAVF